METTIRDQIFDHIERRLSSTPKWGRRILNGLDYDFICSWIDGGIPGGAVLQGIDTSLNNFKPTRQRPVIKSMAYFEPEIERAAQIWWEWEEDAARRDPDYGRKNL